MAVGGIRNLKTRSNQDIARAASVARVGWIPAGNNKEGTAEEIKTILGIEGDAMGTLNTQEMFNKTVDGGLFTS